jgi:hypothetical protein
VPSLRPPTHPMVVRAAARVVGRRLLNHCFTVTGGEDHHLATGAAKSSGGSTTGDGAANATATPGGVGADLWAPAGVESGVHAVTSEPYTPCALPPPNPESLTAIVT